MMSLAGCGQGAMGEPGAMGDPGSQGPPGTIDPSQAILNGTVPQSASFDITGDAVIGGNVGIGTAAPGSKVEIDQAEGANALQLRNTTNGTSWTARLQGDGATANNLHLDHSTLPDAVMIRSSGQLCVADSVKIGASGAIYQNW